MRTEGTVASAYAVPIGAIKTGIPAVLYLCQNNLQYVGITYLDAATYTVTYQSKIMWSGILTVLILGRSLTTNKWAALAMISAGVAAVQLAGLDSGSQNSETNSFRFFGLMLILAAACFSSLA